MKLLLHGRDEELNYALHGIIIYLARLIDKLLPEMSVFGQQRPCLLRGREFPYVPL
jgi:hypothetical protein